MPLARSGLFACGDQARYAVPALTGDDPYRFRPTGGDAVPVASSVGG